MLKGAPVRASCLLLLLTAGGCSQPPHLARGPIELGGAPTVVPFETSVASSSPRWELCFEFDRPGDSHEAGRIHAVLLGDSERRYALLDATLDRRGESVVCTLGRVAALVSEGAEGPEDAAEGGGTAEPRGAAGSAERTITYVAVQLSADVPLRLRGLRGGSRP